MGWSHTLFRESWPSGSKVERGAHTNKHSDVIRPLSFRRKGKCEEKRYTARKQIRRLEAFIHRTRERSFIAIYFYFVWFGLEHLYSGTATLDSWAFMFFFGSAADALVNKDECRQFGRR
jgi:hypothetical protein